MQVFFARWPSGRKVKWRSLTWQSSRSLIDNSIMTARLPSIATLYRAVVLDGPPLDGDPVYQAPAGLVEWIARALLDSNPFNGEYKDVKRALEMKRIELKSSWLNSAKSIIAGIFVTPSRRSSSGMRRCSSSVSPTPSSSLGASSSGRAG